MTDETLDAIAQALTSVPPRAVDAGVLADADPDVLADALRRAVADLPAAEQRARLAAAFAAMTPAGAEAAASQTEALEAELLGAAPMTMRSDDRPKISAATAGLLALRPFTAVKAGALAGIAVIALLVGVLAGVVTEDDAPQQLAVPGAAEQPIPVLQPVSHSATPPTDEQVAGMFPPDPEAQIAAAEAAAADNPEAFEADDLDPAGAAYVPDPDADLYVSGYIDDPGYPAGPEQGDVADADAPDRGVIVDEPPTTGGDDGGPTDVPAGGSEVPEDGGTGPGDAGDPGDSGAAPGTPGDGSGDDGGDDGAVVDLCAGDTPPVECDGIGGTVTLAIVEPFAYVVTDPLALTDWPDSGGTPCADNYGDELAADRFVLFIAANNLGSFTARYRIAGSSDRFLEASGATSEAWRDHEGWTQTCIVAERPTLEAASLEMEIIGIGADDSGTATFNGIVELDGTEAALRRDGRPEVRVEARSASEFDVIVPVGESERAEVTLVQRDPAGVVDCDAPVVAEADELVTATVPGGIVINREWDDHRFRLTAEDPGHFAICVLWSDTFTPPTELERASIVLDIPTVADTTFLFARYDQNACVGGGCPSTPLMVNSIVQDVEGVTCNAMMYEGGYHPDEPVPMCTMTGVPSRLVLSTFAGFTRASGGIRYDGVRSSLSASFDPRCEETSCTTWYSVPVRAPGGLFEGNGGVVGRALIGIRVNGGSAGVVIGDEVPEVIDDASIIGPRLDWSTIQVSLDPNDPARTVLVNWQADRPVTIEAEAVATGGEEGPCPEITAGTLTPDVSGSLRLAGLCPGTLHYVEFTLVDEMGNKTVYNSLGRPTDMFQTDWVQQSYPITTQPLQVIYDYEVTLTESPKPGFEGGAGQGVIPTRMLLELPGHTAIDYQQFYYGEPYLELDCADPSHFNRSGSGVTAEVSGATFRPLEAEFLFQTYRPTSRGVFDSFNTRDRVCPSLYNQVNHTPTEEDLTCYVDLRNFVPTRANPRTLVTTNELNRMLEGNEATLVATVDSRCDYYYQQLSTTFTVTLTVRMREA